MAPIDEGEIARGGKNSWQTSSGKKRSRELDKNGKGDSRTCRTVTKAGRIAAWCQKESKKHLHAIDDDESETVEETPDNDEQLQTWYLLHNGKMSSGKK